MENGRLHKLASQDRRNAHRQSASPTWFVRRTLQVVVTVIYSTIRNTTQRRVLPNERSSLRVHAPRRQCVVRGVQPGFWILVSGGGGGGVTMVEVAAIAMTSWRSGGEVNSDGVRQHFFRSGPRGRCAPSTSLLAAPLVASSQILFSVVSSQIVVVGYSRSLVDVSYRTAAVKLHNTAVGSYIVRYRKIRKQHQNCQRGVDVGPMSHDRLWHR